MQVTKEFIRKEHPDVYLQKDFIDRPEKFKTSQICGPMGGGKSGGLLALAHYQASILNTVPVIIVADSGDVPQLVNVSLKDYNKKLADFAGSTKRRYCPLECLLAKDLSTDEYGEIVDKHGILANFRKADTQAKIVVSIAHPTQLGRTAKLLYQTHSVDGPRAAGIRPCSMIADESHLTMFPHQKDLTLVPNGAYEDTDAWISKALEFELVTAVLPAAMRSITGGRRRGVPF